MNRLMVRATITLMLLMAFLSVALAPVAAQGTADLAVTAAADEGKAKVGDIVRYTLTVTNLGPDAAAEVEAAFNMGDQFTPVTITCNQGSGNWSGCTFGALEAGASASAVLEARVCCLPKTESRHAFLEAYVSSAFDPNSSNNAILTFIRLIGGWNFKK